MWRANPLERLSPCSRRDAPPFRDLPGSALSLDGGDVDEESTLAALAAERRRLVGDHEDRLALADQHAFDRSLVGLIARAARALGGELAGRGLQLVAQPPVGEVRQLPPRLGHR